MIALSAGLTTSNSLRAGDFTPYRKQMSSIADEIIKTRFIEKGMCESLRQCQLDGFVKYKSSSMYVYGVKGVSEAIAIIEVALRQQNSEKLPQLELTIYKETNQEFKGAKGAAPAKIIQVTSIIEQ